LNSILIHEDIIFKEMSFLKELQAPILTYSKFGFQKFLKDFVTYSEYIKPKLDLSEYKSRYKIKTNYEKFSLIFSS